MQTIQLTVHTTLFGAAQLIRLRGWAKHTMQTALGALCLRGAIRRYIAEAFPAGTDAVEYTNAIEDAEQRLQEHVHTLHDRIHMTVWNDTVCLSQEDAIAMLEGAALQHAA